MIQTLLNSLKQMNKHHKKVWKQKNKRCASDGIRTRDLWIRSSVPCPLGHESLYHPINQWRINLFLSPTSSSLPPLSWKSWASPSKWTDNDFHQIMFRISLFLSPTSSSLPPLPLSHLYHGNHERARPNEQTMISTKMFRSIAKVNLVTSIRFFFQSSNLLRIFHDKLFHNRLRDNLS